MTLISHTELLSLVEQGVIQGVEPGAINAASIDIHMGRTIILERDPIGDEGCLIDYRKRESFTRREYDMPDHGWALLPGEFILAQSIEIFNLPNNISAEYKLKSSMARIGLEHMNAGWCDAGWNGSVLTLEFKNMLQHHSILIRPGDAIGQMVFFKHDPVSTEASYAARGRYNNDKVVQGIKE